MNKTEEQARTDRANTAKIEWAALKAWQKGGEVGERPATPTLDEAQDGAFKPLRSGTTRTKGVKAPKQSEPLIFAINGKPVREKVNAFGELSWSGTANLVGDSKRIKPAELVAILEEQFEISNPRFTAWGPITLANGVTLQVCAVDADGQPVGLASMMTTATKPVNGVVPGMRAGVKAAQAARAAEKLAEPIVEAPAVESKPKRVRPSRSKAAVAERAAAKNRKAS